jgi:hypothetical protein
MCCKTVETRKEGVKMKIRLGVLTCAAGLVIFAFVPILHAADRELQIAYRRHPADPALVQSARRLAAETAPPW